MKSLLNSSCSSLVSHTFISLGHKTDNVSEKMFPLLFVSPEQKLRQCALLLSVAEMWGVVIYKASLSLTNGAAQRLCCSFRKRPLLVCDV